MNIGRFKLTLNIIKTLKEKKKEKKLENYKNSISDVILNLKKESKKIIVDPGKRYLSLAFLYQ